MKRIPCYMQLHHRLSIAAAIASFALNTSTRATIIYVNDDANGANNGTSWLDAYKGLQDALAQAQPGDEIRIAQGTYKPAGPGGPREATFSIPDGVVIQGGYSGLNGGDAHPEAYYTWLSGDLNGDDAAIFVNYSDNSYHVVTANAVTAGTQLRGVIIIGGSASTQGGVNGTGGGVLCMNSVLEIQGCTIQKNQAYDMAGGVMAAVNNAPSSITMIGCTVQGNREMSLVGIVGGVAVKNSTVVNCVFSNNGTGLAGSAAALDASQTTVESCLFMNNVAGEDGGAIYGGDLTVRNCQFIGNGAGYYGAMVVSGQATVSDCLFQQNHGFEGGAIKKLDSTPINIVRCRFIENEASFGGALSAQATVVNCDFIGNWVYPHAAGVGAAVMGSMTAVNCMFSGNWTIDWGVLYGGPFDLTNCTIVGNETYESLSGAIDNHSGATQIRNCILWDNSGSAADEQTQQIFVGGGSVTVNNSIVQGWTGSLGGSGNSGADPQFIDADGPDDQYGTEDDNPRLSESSPCRDAGNNSYLPHDTYDLDQDGNTVEPVPFDLDSLPRVVSGIVDLGAYEIQAEGCPADSSGDGQVNSGDLLALINSWGVCSSPDCPADITNDGSVNTSDLLFVLTHWGACP